MNTYTIISHLCQTFYVRIHPDRVEVRDIATGQSVSQSAIHPFTTRRLLVGHFDHAQKTLKKAMEQLTGRRLFRPMVVVHPMAMLDGGLSQVEAKVLHEMTLAAGAHRVVVWTGSVLDDAEVAVQIRQAF